MADRNYISLELTYPFEFYPRLDKKLEDLIGSQTAASGAGCGDRDLAFNFYDEGQAIEAGKLLKKKVPELTRIYVQEWKNDDWHDIRTIKGAK